MPSITGWYDPTPRGGALRLAANSYLASERDPGVRHPGLRKGDVVVLEDGRVRSVNGLAPETIAARPEFASLGAVPAARLPGRTVPVPDMGIGPARGQVETGRAVVSCSTRSPAWRVRTTPPGARPAAPCPADWTPARSPNPRRCSARPAPSPGAGRSR